MRAKLEFFQKAQVRREQLAQQWQPQVRPRELRWTEAR